MEMDLTPSKTLIALVVLLFVFLFMVLSMLSGQVKIEGLWFVFPYSNSIRVSTVGTGIACFMLVLFLTRRKGLKSIYYASLAVIFSIGLYEIVWFNLAVVIDGWGQRIWEFSALLGWVFLGLREVFRTKPPRISIALYSIYVASMIAWISLGFKFNVPGTTNYDFVGETFNIVSKFSLPIGYAFHIALAKTSVLPFKAESSVK
jgi:hypothetical protein